MHHDKSHSFEDDASKLEQDSDQNELDLANGGDDHSDNDEGDIEEDSHVGFLDAHGPAGKKNCNRCASLIHSSASSANDNTVTSTDLQHLNECHTEVQVGQVATDQGQAEHGPNWHDSP